MAWIKVNTALDSKPQTVRMARILKINPAYIIGLLVKFWSKIDALTDNGRLEFCGPEEVDNIIGHKGFGKALEAVKWISYDENGATIPEFDKHNGNSAKKRADAQERQRRSRKSKSNAGQVSQGGHKSVTEICDKNVTHKRRGEESRVEENNNSVELLQEPDPTPDFSSLERTAENVLKAAEGLGISRAEAEKFYLYNESRGWQGVRDWLAALKLWQKRIRPEAIEALSKEVQKKCAADCDMTVDFE